MSDERCKHCGGPHRDGECPTFRLPSGLPAGEATLLAAAASSEPQGLSPGARFGRYEIIDTVGRGGMGVVYLARDVELGREVALKVMIGGTGASFEEVERFRREATSVASLSHPGIVALYEFGAVDGRPFFSMEYVRGKSLDQALKQERFDVERALRVVREVAVALHFAHERGLVHRDIKPANVLLDAEGRPRLTDFGLARRVEAEGGLTLSGAVLGTPAYMSPEQAKGDVRSVDARSDVYSLGAVLYESLTLTRPHTGASIVEVLRHAAEQDPVPPRRIDPRLPRDVETICLKALARTRDRRYESAAALAEDIGRFLGKEPIRARPPSIVYRAVRWTQRSPVRAALFAVLLLVGVPWAAWTLTRPGTVSVKVTWDGRPFRPAEVKVGDEALPLVPYGAAGEVSAGTWVVRVRAPGFVDRETAVDVRRGGMHEVAVSMEHEKGTFELEVEPTGGSVYVDGVDFGSRLRHFRIDTGSHDLLVRKEGYRDQRLRWTADAARPTTGFASLAQAVRFSRPRRGTNYDLRWFDDPDGNGLPGLLHRNFNTIELFDPWEDRTVWTASTGGQVTAPCAQADLDLDGTADFIAFATEREETHVIAWSGRVEDRAAATPKVLWRVGAPPGAKGQLSLLAPPVLEDINGDRVPDVLCSSLWMDLVCAFSGKNGDLLWKQEVAGWPLACALGDGPEKGTRRLFVPTNRAVYAIDPANGQVQWRAPIDPIALSKEDISFGRRLSGNAVWGESLAAAAPLDDSPGDDLLLHWGSGGDTSKIELRALRGSDGGALWTVPGAGWCTLRARDVDGVSVLTASMKDESDAAKRAIHLLDPRSGSTIRKLAVEGQCDWLDWEDGTLSLCEAFPRKIVLRSPKDGSLLLEFPLPEDRTSWPVLADWDGDGAKDIVLGFKDSTVRAFDRAGREVGACLIERPASRIVAGGDADGDGFEDLLVQAEGPVLIVGPKVLWSRKGLEAFTAPAVPVDLDADGDLELVVSCGIDPERTAILDARTGATVALADAHSMRAAALVPRAGGGFDLLMVRYDVDGYRLLLSSGEDGRRLRAMPFEECYTTPALGDVDGDGRVEILICSWDGASKIVALDGETWKERWTHKGSKGSWMTPLVIDVDGKAPPEVVAGFNDGELKLLDGPTGEARWTVDMGARALSSPPAVGDLDGDGALELVLPSLAESSYDLVALRAADGREVWRVQWGGGDVAPLLRDIDGDGRLEVIAGTMKRGVLCLKQDRSIVWSYAVPPDAAKGPHAVEARLSIEDLDADGSPELLSTFSDGTLRVLDARTGRLEWTFRTGDRHIEGGASAVDVDGDGTMEVLLAANDRRLYCLRTPRRR